MKTSSARCGHVVKSGRAAVTDFACLSGPSWSYSSRFKAFKAALGDVDGVSLEHTLDNFKRDANPESELLIWERIASTFALFLTHNPTTNAVVRGEMYSVLLGASMGVEDWGNIRHLTENQINDLVLNYRALRLH